MKNRLLFLSIMVLLSGLVTISTSAFAQDGLPDGLTKTTVLVTFQKGSLKSEPSRRFNVLSITDRDSKSHTIFESSGTMTIEPYYRKSSSFYKLEGPWVITIIGPVESKSLKQQIRSHSSVVSVEELVDSEAKICGDHAKAVFPGSSYTYFCDSQSQLHKKIANEPAFPGDICTEEWDSTHFDHDMDLPQAWAITEGDSNVVVAIVDTGLDWTHPALGGPGPQTSVPDSLIYYNEGVLYRNVNEEPGDANGDGRPGISNVDDDGDGLIDEDGNNFLPGNTPESDVYRGSWDSATDSTLTDLDASWGAGANLVGSEIHLILPSGNVVASETILAHTTTTLTTAVPWNLPDGWLTVMNNYPVSEYSYRIGDGLDSDGDGSIDDFGYNSDYIADDDENGYIDDIRGWDFYNNDSNYLSSTGFPNEDYITEDNDPRSFGPHGTALASQVATSPTSEMKGIAPGVKILPLRAGAGIPDPDWDVKDTIDGNAYKNAIVYAADMGADIIATAVETGLIPWNGNPGKPIYTDVLQDVITNSDIFHTNGAGNSGDTINSEIWSDFYLTGSTSVAGLNPEDHLWSDGNGTSRTGSWVDISARANEITIATTYRYLAPGAQQVYQEGWGGTSLSSPIIAGVAALVKSAYPHWTNTEIRNKILASTDDIYQYDTNGNSTWNPGYEGKFGTGRVNAYKALSFYGPIGTAQSDTTWTGDVWVSGDIVIPEGVTLNVAAGCTIHVAQDDITESGLSPNVIEFDVAGTLSMLGTAGDPITIEGFFVEGEDHEWGPLVFTGSSTVSNGIFHYVDFLDGGVMVKKGTTPASDRINLDFQNCNFVNVDTGIYLQELDQGDVLNVTGCGFTGKGSASFYGIYLAASTGATNYNVTINGDTTIEDFYFGVLAMYCNDNLTVSNTTITDCEVGVLSSNSGTSEGPAIGPDLEIVSPIQHGLSLGGGSPTISGVTITGSLDRGIFMNNASPVFQTPATQITGSGTHGLDIVACTLTTSLAHLDIQNSSVNGIRMTDSSVDISRFVTLENNAVGVYYDNSTSNLSGTSITGSNVSVLATNNSAVEVRSCTIGAVSACVLADYCSTIDCGVLFDSGYNRFISYPTYYGANYNTVTMDMVGNCYDGSPLVSSQKFQGPVNYTNGYCR